MGGKEVGFVEGENVSVEYHWAGSQSDRLQELVADMVRARVSVIAAIGLRAISDLSSFPSSSGEEPPTT
jgi:hypothetical protein